ncbi:DUF1963 domain-containing protein [Nonomuraea terrae]|uniref:DUF1963 domain-containing protein n=1 Tax=Nonomuraea terrae TaxID=2530383 RepID=UPI001CB72A0B|nr:DUF1963 domain-containing protein [Nonomuraea terrae]
MDGPVVGHFGGPLMLPADVTDPRRGQHLIASIDLAALPEDATGLPLPPDGRLLLFAHPDGLAAIDEYGELDPVTSSATWAAKSEEQGIRPGTGERANPADWVLLAQWLPAISGLEGAFVHWAIRRQDVGARRFDRVYVTMFFAP